MEIETILKTNNGELINGDNIEVLKTYANNTFDNCISDFPYNLSFMNKKWDTQKNFYDWCYQRAEALYPKIKPGGYVLIFGHHKSNHRMKCAFEDAGFNIVEEIDYIYGSGFPKNQDISKMFDKKAGVKREIIGYSERNDRILPSGEGGTHGTLHKEYREKGRESIKLAITEPSSDSAKQWNGFKTSGLKPCKEIITVFQKPLEGKYLDNIEKYGCGAMNIDACRVPTSQEDKDIINAKSSKNPTTNYSDSEDKIYGAYEKDMSMPANELGRFPSNVILDDTMGEILDNQSGISKSTDNIRHNKQSVYAESDTRKYGKYKDCDSHGFIDEGGASRYFLNINYENEDFVPFMYCPKATKKEKGEGNIHVTVKPKKLIKWLIKLVTPKNGITLDITAGSITHGLCCEELNKEEDYNLKWVDIEMQNTEKEPYCNIGKDRINTYLNNINK